MLVMIFGPQAVGKMTVGEELAKRTGLTLFHNHMSIEFTLQFYEYHTREAQDMIRILRKEVMTSIANSSNKGMIFTFVWALDLEEDWNYVKQVEDIFDGHEQYFIELYSDLNTRLKRNKTENRLSKKPSKRDIEASNERIINTMKKYKVSSTDDDFGNRHYLKIDNTNISAGTVSEMIIDHFKL